MLMARDTTIIIVTSEMVLSIIINSLARRVSGKASVGLNAVAVFSSPGHSMPSRGWSSNSWPARI